MNTMIKNLDEENWHFLKVEAAKERITIGELFNRIIEEYKNIETERSAKVWQKIFSRKPILSKEEVKEMQKNIGSFRKEFNFE